MARKPKSESHSAQPSPAAADGSPDFPIVGIGASAGGLDAYGDLLRQLPPDTGMGFVLVQHLDPNHATMLPEILSRCTTMPVVEVRDEPAVAPNSVFVIPPNRDMLIVNGHLRLSPREERGARHRPIDEFFRSLAADHGHRAIGVVLSGTGSDGTLGINDIKGAGGVTFAQDGTAAHDGMPRSAIATGNVDFVLPPAKIAEELARIGRHPHLAPANAQNAEASAINKALNLLHDSTGVDFTHYKSTTLLRRISRRMLLNKIERLDDYLQMLRADPVETQALYHDILISVTSFFRDPEAFDAIKEQVFPALVDNRPRQEPVRLWTLGCSTGEEAYSLAMTFVEFAAERELHIPVQVFATDLNDRSIDKARAGLFSKNIALDVSPERLRRFFVDTESGFRIAKSIRDICVFARQNVLVDPPFSRMDFISCRNLLIYMEPVLQRRRDSDVSLCLARSRILVAGKLRDGLANARAVCSRRRQAQDLRQKAGAAARGAHGVRDRGEMDAGRDRETRAAGPPFDRGHGSGARGGPPGDRALRPGRRSGERGIRRRPIPRQYGALPCAAPANPR